MAAFKSCMAHYEGPELCRVEPNLAPGEVEMIAVWHDESCFHANDYKTHAYLLPGQQILQRKGRGRIIHESGFIDAIDEGEVVEEARKIIYPGVNGPDAWWDTAQLLTQMKDVMHIFEAAHPNHQALFIFDQFSAHASLPEDALRAFDMNKSNGGKQWHQHDTVIPQSNPSVEHCRKIQKMTLPDGWTINVYASSQSYNMFNIMVNSNPPTGRVSFTRDQIVAENANIITRNQACQTRHSQGKTNVENDESLLVVPPSFTNVPANCPLANNTIVASSSSSNTSPSIANNMSTTLQVSTVPPSSSRPNTPIPTTTTINMSRNNKRNKYTFSYQKMLNGNLTTKIRVKLQWSLPQRKQELASSIKQKTGTDVLGVRHQVPFQ
ncbi:hypothetical protein DFJ58DRAFT_838897 [Suillus subalutaceus]|uniref:uncharacterized protein n=1 Tax=Suillus subalutaceus TaxID=48586 RepID=UPI001B87EFBF|nr:uncharacterized protein DFJ58DRAFT_838897 [Suillus subalutaceus]KAG1864780.1 hypothetical protein DFJ58DRAFT_838897 [Suillus subalutaceus]